MMSFGFDIVGIKSGQKTKTWIADQLNTGTPRTKDRSAMVSTTSVVSSLLENPM